MVNVNKLRGKMVEMGINADKMAEMIGIDRATFYRKLNNSGETFLIKEADIICRELKLTKDEVNAIFFCQYVA